MTRTNTPLTALVLSYIAFGADVALTYRQLLERVATHFNALGQPDGWMSRATHLWTMGGAALGISILLLTVFYCVRFFPLSMINLPRRDYWMAPERSRETFDTLFRAGAWLACLEVCLMLGLHLLIVAANSSSPVRLSSTVWLVSGVFLAIVGAWVTLLVRRFSAVS